MHLGPFIFKEKRLYVPIVAKGPSSSDKNEIIRGRMNSKETKCILICVKY